MTNNDATNTQGNWQAFIGEKVCDLDFEQIKQFVVEGKLSPTDKIRCNYQHWRQLGGMLDFKNLFSSEILEKFEKAQKVQKLRRTQEINRQKDVRNELIVEKSITSEIDYSSLSRKLTLKDFRAAQDYPVKFALPLFIGGTVNLILTVFTFFGIGIYVAGVTVVGVYIIAITNVIALTVNFNFTDAVIRNFLETKTDESYMINFGNLSFRKNLFIPLTCSILSTIIAFIPIFIVGSIYNDVLVSSKSGHSYLMNHGNGSETSLTDLIRVQGRETNILFLIIFSVSSIIGIGLFSIGQIVSSTSRKFTEAVNPVSWYRVFIGLGRDSIKIGFAVFIFAISLLAFCILLFLFFPSNSLFLVVNLVSQYVAFYLYMFMASLGGIATFKLSRAEEEFT
jgi:hypothetical protein